MSLPAPPEPFDPTCDAIPAGTILYRVHEPTFPTGKPNDGTVGNPGFGKPTRFAFFGDPVVPVLYAADMPEGAVHESILHDTEPGAFIPRVHWQTKVLTALRVTGDLTVARLHSDGLRRFGLFAADLTDTDATTYPETVAWAEAAWRRGLDGVSYMCRHYNISKAVCLFTDRVRPSGLEVRPEHAGSRAFVLPGDAEWLASLALDMRVTIRP